MAIDDGEMIKHPSFGQISVHRTQGGHGMLYGSPMRHGSQVRVTITESKVERRHGEEWYYPGKEQIEIAMSEAQWATFVSSFNIGGGTPCTFVRREMLQGDGSLKYVGIDPPPQSVGTKEDAVAEIEGRLRDLTKMLVDAKAALEAARSKKTVSKADLAPMAGAIDRVDQELRANIPFFVEQFAKKTEKMVERAKADIHAAAQQQIINVGLAAVGENMDPSLRSAIATELRRRGLETRPVVELIERKEEDNEGR